MFSFFKKKFFSTAPPAPTTPELDVTPEAAPLAPPVLPTPPASPIAPAPPPAVPTGGSLMGGSLIGSALVTPLDIAKVLEASAASVHVRGWPN